MCGSLDNANAALHAQPAYDRALLITYVPGLVRVAWRVLGGARNEKGARRRDGWVRAVRSGSGSRLSSSTVDFFNSGPSGMPNESPIPGPATSNDVGGGGGSADLDALDDFLSSAPVSVSKSHSPRPQARVTREQEQERENQVYQVAFSVTICYNRAKKALM